MNHPARLALILCFAPILCAELTPSLAAAGESVPLRRVAQAGQRAEVSEEQRFELTYRYKGQDAAVGAAERVVHTRRYTEEVRRPQPLVLVRDYTQSERSEAKAGAEPVTQQTSVHGRKVLVTGLELAPAAAPFEISDQDREALRFDRLARAFLPTSETASRGERWKLPSGPFAQALFAGIVPANAHHGGASVQLKKVAKSEGREVATLKVKLDLRTDLRVDFPELRLVLEGTILWDLDEEDLLEATLEGSLTFVSEKEGLRVTGSGPLSYRYQARYLIPREEAAAGGAGPPPPGATALVCTHDSRHRIALETLRCCTQCGKTFDAERKCPEGHPWVLRHCFHDGAPLRHE